MCLYERLNGCVRGIAEILPWRSLRAMIERGYALGVLGVWHSVLYDLAFEHMFVQSVGGVHDFECNRDAKCPTVAFRLYECYGMGFGNPRLFSVTRFAGSLAVARQELG